MNHQSLMSRSLAAILAITLFAPQTLFARYQPSPGRPNFFSLDQEVQIGQQESSKIDQTMPLVADAELNRYIQNLGARLVSKAPGPKYPYTFKVVNEADINAFAMPGGPIHINLGTIQAADNEAQLAGVMAHEMSHVIMRHSTHMASQQMMYQAPLSILGGMLGNGMKGQLAQMGIGFLANSVFLRYSRDAEKQADLTGAGIMHDAGFNPQAMVDFFRKLEQQGGRSGSQFLSDHPNPGNRVQYVSAEVKTLSSTSYSQDSAEFRKIKRKVSGLKGFTAEQIQQQQKQQSGPIPGAQSSGRDGIAPSGQFAKLNHTAYTVSYPNNWQVYGDENSEVTIAPQSGISQNAVAYGVIISTFQPEDRGSSNALDDATQQLLEQLHQSNPDLRRAGNLENVTVDGANAKSLFMTGPSPIVDNNNKALRERDWVVITQSQDGTLVYMVFIAPQNDFNQLQATYEHMVRSYRSSKSLGYRDRNRR
jgi:hypothetical protein